jgi:hypothetical protein
MTRLDDYRSALLAGFPEISRDDLVTRQEAAGPDFVSFVVDHGLGPLWDVQTARPEFRESRLAAEALYAAQQHVLEEVDAVLGNAGIEYAVFKGAVNRLLLYDNPAIRACHDLDLLVRASDRVRAAEILARAGFEPFPEARSISRELVLSRGGVNIDLHWGLLREGRLAEEPVHDMLDRRRRRFGIWLLDDDDAFFVLVVHPAFAKHLGGWDMGLHRVMDIVLWLRTRSYDWQAVRERLEKNGVRTAAWATLCWVRLVTSPYVPRELNGMLEDLRPGRLRTAWIERWLQGNLSERTARAHWARLFGFSLFLHDRPRDAGRALAGRRRAKKSEAEDLAAFGGLLGQ